MFKDCLENVRKKKPLIHNITNYVTVNDVANALLAIGASPIMADEGEEVEEITSICDGLNINIGTLNKHTIEAMKIAGKKASELHHALLLDPVGAGASSLRSATAASLMDEIAFDVVRGNVSELKALALGAASTQGVDASEADVVTQDNLNEMVHFTMNYAKKTNKIIAITGAIDLVADREHCFIIYNGRKEMSRITGTGCMLSGIMTAFLAANSDNKLEAAAAAICTMGLAGEIGYRYLTEGEGNASYRNHIIDALYHIDGKTLEEGARYEWR
ncbi:hydroxyethylthiazole kinase [Sharpea azabuensis]|uniref:hydroxyethylthiazole kinase n=1 Tax=Sharpea azabuensis TaxID=322505 RepID=UPI000ECE4648|nr:hydroxyethylthiazole kinase [Sharpea azabuensis]HCJ13964.1 hydroxyethylthiazole kinase [Erysipelotrichaceae bacterium]